MHSKNADEVFKKATALLRNGRLDEASDALAEVLRLNPHHADAWSLRGRLEHWAGRPFNAVWHYNFAVNVAPERHDLWSDRGIAASADGRVDLARHCFCQSLKLKESFEGHFNFANLLQKTMMIEEAIEHYRAAVRMNASSAPAHTFLGESLICQGEWREGFDELRHRFAVLGSPPRPNFPQWQGENLAGRTILLFADQGFGDEILSLRFAKIVRDRGARVILSVRPQIYALARTSSLADAVIIQGDPAPWPPDYAASLLDVPAFIDVTPDNVPLGGGYLKADNAADDTISALRAFGGLMVGVCWASGNPNFDEPRRPTSDWLSGWWDTTDPLAKRKTLTLDQLSELARPGVALVSLQRQHQSHDMMRSLGIFDPMPRVNDFMDTARIIAPLDLVITVDTAVAHLSGALGKPVWNLVCFEALWPWMHATGKTCWYDSMTIYRQTASREWEDPIRRLVADFQALC